MGARVLGDEIARERAVLQVQPDLRTVVDNVGIDGQRPADGRLRAGRGLAGDAVGGGDEVPELDEIIRALMVCLRGSRDGVIRFGRGRFLGGLLRRFLRDGRFLRQRLLRDGFFLDGKRNGFQRQRRYDGGFGLCGFCRGRGLRLNSFGTFRQGNGLCFCLRIGKQQAARQHADGRGAGLDPCCQHHCSNTPFRNQKHDRIHGYK